MDNRVYYDCGYLVYTYAYRGGLEHWNKDKGIYSKYSGAILVQEGKHNIRKTLYPHYKANRVSSNLDEKQLAYRERANEIYEDINNSNIFNTVSWMYCEADDILAIRALQGYHIVSSDKDFAQLPEECIITKLDGTDLRHNLHSSMPKSLWDIQLTPSLYLLTLCLFGDKADNVDRLIPKGKKAIVESRDIFESTSPWKEAYKIYGNDLLTNLDITHLPNRYMISDRLDIEDVFHYIDSGIWFEYVKERIS